MVSVLCWMASCLGLQWALAEATWAHSYSGTLADWLSGPIASSGQVSLGHAVGPCWSARALGQSFYPHYVGGGGI